MPHYAAKRHDPKGGVDEEVSPRYAKGMNGLRAFRRAKGLGIKKLARIMSVSPSAISRWEHGSRFPTREGLLRLAEALEVPVEVVVSLLMREVADSGPNGQEARGNGQ